MKKRKKITPVKFEVTSSPEFKEKVRHHAEAKELSISAYARVALNEKMDRDAQ